MPYALIIVRALHFGAVAMLLGGAGLLLALHRRDRQTLVALRFAAAAAALTGAAWFALVFTDVTGASNALLDPDAWGAFLSAPFGWPWVVRLGLCALALVATMRGTPVVYVALGIGFTIDQAWLGHAANGTGLDAATPILFYWVHVTTAFAWVGALAMLCVLTVIDGHVPPEGLNLFSVVGTFVVAAILASGITNAALRGLRFADLATTGYGRLVLVKVVLFVAMVGFAIFNRRRSHQRDATLTSSVVTEMALGLAVLAVAAWLGVTPPP